MKIRILSLIMALILACCAFTGCKKSNEDVTSESDTAVSAPEKLVGVKDGKYLNNLTGCYEFDSAEEANSRPVAVMVNNISVAQKVQTGLANASIVYETVVEGGITRLLAIYKNINAVGDIGTVRSARYSYLDLANGHDAIYFHCGADEFYYVPHVNELSSDIININTGANNKYGRREKNGLASEHTMYTTGQLISNAIKDIGHRNTLKDENAFAVKWQNFADEGKSVKHKDGVATKASVYFSGSYITTFDYDADSKMYVKSNKSGNNTDYKTGEKNSYKNVLVLFAKVTNFDDNYHTKIHLDSGEGYYITNGTMKNIKWTKADSYSQFKITDLNGKDVEFNAGNTYVCVPPESGKAKTKIS